MNIALRSFLIALAAGFTLEKATDAVVTENGNAPEVYQVHKQAGPAVQALRIQNSISEGAVMKTLKLDPAKPEDIQTYMSFERGDKEFEMTAEAITLLSKTLKTDAATLAAKMLAADPNAPAPVDPHAPPVDPNAPAPTLKSATHNVLFNLSKKVTPEEAAALNEVLLKSQQVKTGAQQPVQKSADDLKVEKSQGFGREVLGLKDDSRERLEKGGIIVPTDFAPGGTLNPTLGTTLFELAQPQMAVLKDVQTVVMTSFNQEVLVMSGNQRSAIRLGANDVPTTSQMAKTVNGSKKLAAADVDMVFLIDDATALQYQGNLPALDNQVSGFFSNNFATQLEDLGFNGTTDTYDGSTFTTLAKGWITIATAAATGGKAWRLVDSSVATLTTVMGRMDTMMLNLVTNNAPGYTKDHVFIMSFADFKAYEAEYKASRKSDDVLINGAPQQYSGHKIVISNYIATGYMMFTTLKNLIFAYVNGGQQGIRVQRDRVTKGNRTILSVAVDYDFVDLDITIINQP